MRGIGPGEVWKQKQTSNIERPTPKVLLNERLFQAMESGTQEGSRNSEFGMEDLRWFSFQFGDVESRRRAGCGTQYRD